MKNFDQGDHVSHQIKHDMIRALRATNNPTLSRTCTKKSSFKETIDRAVECGFLTVVNTSLAEKQYMCNSKTYVYVYEVTPTEEGLLYLEYLML